MLGPTSLQVAQLGFKHRSAGFHHSLLLPYFHHHPLIELTPPIGSKLCNSKPHVNAYLTVLIFSIRYIRKAQHSSHSTPNLNRMSFLCTQISFVGCLSGREAIIINSCQAEPIKGMSISLNGTKKGQQPWELKSSKSQIPGCYTLTQNIWHQVTSKITIIIKAPLVTCPNTKIK